jgi:hypothetical protein
MSTASIVGALSTLIALEGAGVLCRGVRLGFSCRHAVERDCVGNGVVTRGFCQDAGGIHGAKHEGRQCGASRTSWEPALGCCSGATLRFESVLLPQALRAELDAAPCRAESGGWLPRY